MLQTFTICLSIVCVLLTLCVVVKTRTIRGLTILLAKQDGVGRLSAAFADQQTTIANLKSLLEAKHATLAEIHAVLDTPIHPRAKTALDGVKF